MIYPEPAWRDAGKTRQVDPAGQEIPEDIPQYVTQVCEKGIRITWTEHGIYQAEGTLDEWRAVFGLVGTPDEKVMGRLNAVLGDYEETPKLAEFAEFVRVDKRVIGNLAAVPLWRNRGQS
jgi:hypothetical protein